MVTLGKFPTVPMDIKLGGLLRSALLAVVTAFLAQLSAPMWLWFSTIALIGIVIAAEPWIVRTGRTEKATVAVCVYLVLAVGYTVVIRKLDEPHLQVTYNGRPLNGATLKLLAPDHTLHLGGITIVNEGAVVTRADLTTALYFSAPVISLSPGSGLVPAWFAAGTGAEAGYPTVLSGMIRGFPISPHEPIFDVGLVRQVVSGRC